MRHCEALLAEFGLFCDPTATVETLRPWQRPMMLVAVLNAQHQVPIGCAILAALVAGILVGMAC